MKTNRLIITTAILLLCVLYARAYDFTVDGFYYNVIPGTNTVEVTYPDYPDKYEGNIIIPETVSWESKAYQVTKIGDGAFSWSDLSNLTIPVSVTTIGQNVFSDAKKLTVINADNNNPAFSSSDGILFDKGKTTLVAYPAGKTATEYAIPGSVKVIGGYAFNSCVNLISINIPDGVKTIENNAFRYCENLSSIIIPNSVTSIGDYVFYCCYKLNSVTLPNSIEGIGRCTFFYCWELASIAIPESVTSIGNEAFSSCRKLKSMTLPNSIEKIGSHAFSSCRELTSIAIPDGVTSIEYATFYGCINLEAVNIPKTVKTIAGYAFRDCKIASIKIPNTVTSIDGSAFSYCNSFTAVIIDNDNPNYSTEDGILYNKGKTSLIIYPSGKSATTFIVPDMVKNIGDYAFCGNATLTSVVLPEGLETIGYYAFNNARIESIALPNTLKSIGYAAFEHSDIKSITIPASVESISSWAFTKCPYLENIVFEGPVQSMGGVVFAGYADSPRSYTMEVKCEPFKIDNSLGYVDLEHSTLIVPNGKKGLFLAAAGWQDFGTILEKSEVSAGVPVIEENLETYISGGMLHIGTPYSETIQIYSITGSLLGQFSKPAGAVSYSVSSFNERLLIIRGSSGWVKKIMQTK